MLTFHSFKELFLFLYNKNGIGKMLSRATIHRGVANRIPRSSATFFTSPPFCMHWRIARLSSSTRWNIDFFLRSVVFSIRLFVLCGKGKLFSAFFQFHSFKDLFCWKRIPSLVSSSWDINQYGYLIGLKFHHLLPPASDSPSDPNSD